MNKEMAKKITYMGAGVGLVLFAIFGLLPGSFLGGVMGINIASALFGAPLTSSILSRLIVGVSMIMGIMVSGVMFVVSSSVAGWLLGTAIDKIMAHEAREDKNLLKSIN